MSRNYIEQHFEDIKKYANVIEQRIGGTQCALEDVLADNAYYLKMCRKYNCDYIRIDHWNNIEDEF